MRSQPVVVALRIVVSDMGSTGLNTPPFSTHANKLIDRAGVRDVLRFSDGPGQGMAAERRPRRCPSYCL